MGRILHVRLTVPEPMDAANGGAEQAPTVLLVDANQMNVLRLSELFRSRGFNVEVCEDGDAAVDEYIRLDPELVVLALDLPSLDGHLAALEMREHGGDERLLFVAPKSMSDLARHAAHSAGAVGVLEKPVSRASLEEAWPRIIGPVPEAPGLEDLDELYPDREGATPPAPLPLPQLPALDALPLPTLPLPVVAPSPAPAAPAPRKKRGRLLVLLLLLVGGGAAAAWRYGWLM